MFSIRQAAENDIEVLCTLDLIAQRESERRELIRCAVNLGKCFVAVADEKVIGYAVLNYNFYHSGFIEMIYIGSQLSANRTGVAEIKISSKQSMFLLILN
jgi:hypothetical protein